MSVFTRLPQDMLQHEINHYLDPVSRMSWNEVLRPEERVFKKFPADYTTRHQIRVSYARYESIVRELNRLLAKRFSPRSRTVKQLKKYFAFFHDIENSIPIMYQRGLKARFMQELQIWNDETDFYDSLTGDVNFLGIEVVGELRLEAVKAFLKVASIPYVRHVGMKS